MKLINNNKIKNRENKPSGASTELFLKNVIQQITEITKVESVEGIDESRMGALKLKTISLLSEFASEKAKDPMYWKHYIYESPEFQAYFNTNSKDENKATIVFHQYVGSSNLHNYFTTAEEMLKAINHLFGRKLEKEEEASHQR